MATPEITTHPTPAQGRTVSATPTTHETPCTYCQRPIAKRILAARKSYCSKLCAAMGLIVDVNDENRIDDGSGIDAVLQLVESVFYEGPTLIPVTVRDRDAEGARECETFPDKEGTRTILVCIADEGTPDWSPDPILDAEQDDIDYAVDTLLRFTSLSAGEGARA